MVGMVTPLCSSTDPVASGDAMLAVLTVCVDRVVDLDPFYVRLRPTQAWPPGTIYGQRIPAILICVCDRSERTTHKLATRSGDAQQ